MIIFCLKDDAKIRKIFGICKFFDAKKEEKWKKMGCRMLCDRMDNVRAGSNFYKILV